MPSSSTLFIGVDLKTVDLVKTPVVQYTSLKEGQVLPAGSLVQRWDFVAPAGPAALTAADRQPWRLVGDPEADEIVEILGLGPGADALTGLENEAERDGGNATVRTFWHKMSAGPKDEVDHGLIKEGQQVYRRYAAHFFFALLYFSLTGGFASPNFTGVLRETGYMTSGKSEATFKRLLETTLFLVDTMKDMTPVTGGKGRENSYDKSTYGVPINQGDLAVVLGAFMVGPVWALRRMGINLTTRETSAYQSVWRHVGFFLGIEPQLLDRVCHPYFHNTEVAFASLLFAVFPRDAPSRPAPSTATSTYALLAAVTGRPPKPHLSIGFHCEFSRLLLGPILADQLALPAGSWVDRALVWKEVAAGWAFVEFGRWYRAGWETERIKLTSELVEYLIVSGLGERRSVFSWREEKDWADMLREGESEAPGIKLGKAVSRNADWRWNVLICEMVLVLVLAVTGAAFTGQRVYSMI